MSGVNDFTRQQSAAINGQGDLLVVAGAGTGKTHTLIARCLRLVAEEGVSLENILMVTFTEAAAAEMRARLRAELLKLQTIKPPISSAQIPSPHPSPRLGGERGTISAPENASPYLAEQLALLDTANISTLHGFCLQLAREHFHQLGLDPQFGVLDEQQSRPLQREALDALLERHYSGTDAESLAAQQLIRTVGRGGDRPIRQLVLKLHAYSQSLPDPATWLDAQQKQFEAATPAAWRETLLHAVADWRDEWQPRLDEFRGTVAVDICRQALAELPETFSSEEAATALRAVSQADALKENWPTGTVGKVRDHIEGFFDDAEFLAGLVPGADGEDALAEDWTWGRQQMLALLSLAREFSADFAARKRELGGVDFADLEQFALRALGLPGVAETWRARLEYLFVDEYQDINAAQDAILKALSRDGKAGNRFLVGDVKQSIYRFRLANPKIFQAYQKSWSDAATDGDALSLTENFRSRKALLNFLNPLFGALMREEIGGVAYEGLDFGAAEQRAALADSAPVVELQLIAKADADTAVSEGDEAEEPQESTDQKSSQLDLLATEREARLIARKLRELHDTKYQVWDKDQKDFRAVEWGDMAVLMRSPGGRAEAFAMEFSKAGVPLSAARDGFFGSLEVCDLLNLLRLLDNPLQDVPLAAVLRSPLVGLTVTELAEIRAAGGRDLFWKALLNIQHSTFNTQPPELAGKTVAFLAQFTRWREMVRQVSLAQTLEMVLGETHYEEMLLAGERGAERAANVRRLLDLARQFDPYQRQGLYRFLRFVQQQEDEELDLQPATPAAEDAVRLVSIHKSKGLEFPVVVLAGLGTRFNEQDTSAQVLLHETLGLCPRITPPGAEQSYPSLPYWLAQRDERRELRAEELRLFYVALTRARDRLLLVGTTSRKVESIRWEPSPEPLSCETVLKARNHLDWLLTWLPTATTNAQWHDDRSGGNDLLDWTICDAHDAVFADIGKAETAGGVETETNTWPSAKVVKDLQARLDWKYPFPAATTETAKASVSALRRRVADEETALLFQPKVQGPKSKVRGTGSKFSAAARGTAHHLFLQNVPLTSVGSELDLHNEAERMCQDGILTPEELAGLDFSALAGFWNSDFGQEVQTKPESLVHRELPFTARLNVADLRVLGLPLAGTGLPDDEFVVVQGVADLAVILEREIWLLDFKTDDVDVDGLAAKAKFYEPQLRLYALALSRIYGKKVTDCRLWFLAAGTGVKIQ